MNNTDKKRRVLVVDDERRVLKFIDIDLRFHGFEVITATSGKEALKLVKSVKPDIVLLDIVMPEMDGFQVLRHLRTFSLMPVIAFSANIANYDEAIRLGANAFVSKPFKTDDIISKIDTCLNR